MDNQPPQGPSITPSISGSPVSGPPAPLSRPSAPLTSPPPISTTPPPMASPSGEWPAVPPAPVLIKPPEPPLLSTVVARAPGSTTETGIARKADGGSVDYEVTDDLAGATEESPTMTIPGRPATDTTGAATSSAGEPQAARRPARPAAPVPPEESPLVQLQRTVRRQQALARNPREDLVWQPRFAYTSALVILLALTVVSLPLWIVLYRITDPATNNGAGPRVADLMALCMMLLGGFLTSAAAWVIIIEMRGRVRMVDTLAKTGEREAMAAPEIPVLDAPLDSMATAPPLWDGPATPASFAARAEAQQISAAATLEASSKLLSAFGSVLKSFGQLWAQVAMLAVALALFVGATVLSMRP